MANSRLSKLKEFADDNSKLDKNGSSFSKRVKNTMGKGEIAFYKQFLLFSVFSQDLNCRYVKQEGHDGPVSLHWLIREIHSYQTLHYLGIGLKHKTPYKD